MTEAFVPYGPIEGDAFGELLLAWVNGERHPVVIERDDGLVFRDDEDYVSEPEPSPLLDWVLGRLGPRVLDIGAGAGRYALLLERAGHEVVALDTSPGAVEACRRRGISRTFLGTVEDLAATEPEPFDNFIALGNNLGLIGTPDRALGYFAALEQMAAPGASLLGTMVDPYATDRSVHLAYHEHNRANGRMSGELRVRVRHLTMATPWFSLLWVSPGELREIAARSGWSVSETGDEWSYRAELVPPGAR